MEATAKEVRLGALVLLLASGCTGGTPQESTDPRGASTAPVDSTAQPAAAPSTLDKIKERGVLRVGLNAEYPPFEQVLKGKIQGFDVALMGVVAQRMGVELELINTAWDSIIPSLKTRKFDVIASGMTITPERAKNLGFTRPYYSVRQVIMVRADERERYDSVEALNKSGVEVVSQQVTTGAEMAKKTFTEATVRTFDSANDCLLELLNRKAQAFVFDDPFIKNAEHRYKGKLVGLWDIHLGTEDLGLAVNPADQALLDFLNRTLDEIKGDGTFAALEKKWIREAKW